MPDDRNMISHQPPPGSSAMSFQSAAILTMIAAGHTYEQILHAHPDLDYFDIFEAADEALRLTIQASSEPNGEPPKAYSVSDIRRRHPRAYEEWSTEEETQLRELIDSGHTIARIAGQLGRQRSAIRSRITRLGLFERLSPKEQTRFINAQHLDDGESKDIDDVSSTP